MNTFGISVFTIPVDGTLIDKYLTNIYITILHDFAETMLNDIGFSNFLGRKGYNNGITNVFSRESLSRRLVD